MASLYSWKSGVTPLMIAAATDDVETVKAHTWAQIMQADTEGYTAHDYALSHNSTQVLAHLQTIKPVATRPTFNAQDLSNFFTAILTPVAPVTAPSVTVADICSAPSVYPQVCMEDPITSFAAMYLKYPRAALHIFMSTPETGPTMAAFFTEYQFYQFLQQRPELVGSSTIRDHSTIVIEYKNVEGETQYNNIMGIPFIVDKSTFVAYNEQQHVSMCRMLMHVCLSHDVDDVDDDDEDYDYEGETLDTKGVERKVIAPEEQGDMDTVELEAELKQ